MSNGEPEYCIKIKDRGGVPYRSYTSQSLKKLFLMSKTAATFELMALLEGLSFYGYFLYCKAQNQPQIYVNLMGNKRRNNFYTVIESLYKAHIIDINLQNKLNQFRDKRNSIIHNWFQLKTPLNPKFAEYSYDEALDELFACGMECLSQIHPAIMKLG